MRAATSTAVVLSVSGQSVTVDLGSSSDTLQKLRHVSVAAGDLVQIITVGRARFVAGAIGAGSAPIPEPVLTAPPPDPDAMMSGVWSFGPLEPGTYRDGWREDTAQLWQGQFGTGGPQYGAAWYDDGPTALQGPMVRAALSLRRVAGDASDLAPTIVLYAGGRRPDDAPTVLASTAGPALELDGDPVDWPLPATWLPRLASGEAGGLGCYVAAGAPVLALSAEESGFTLTCYWEV